MKATVKATAKATAKISFRYTIWSRHGSTVSRASCSGYDWSVRSVAVRGERCNIRVQRELSALYSRGTVWLAAREVIMA